MNNPFNPSMLLNQIMNNSKLMQNQTASNAKICYQNKDTAGLEEIAKNLCQTRGVDYERIKAQVMQTHNLR